MKITKEMVDELNGMLAKVNCVLRFELMESESKNTRITIVPSNTLFIDSYIFNCTNAFFAFIETYFKEKGVVLAYNNTRNIMWSENGWDDN